MTPRRRPPASLRAFAVAALVLLAGCASAPSVPQPDLGLQCRNDRGIGGTGLTSGDDRGIGGTGLIAMDRGIGGTGIVGTVTGFGSICVNGFRVAYNMSTPVSIDGIAASADALERGMTVAVMAAAHEGALQASSIDIVHALVGPVTANAPGTFAVMGVIVESSSAVGTLASTFMVGDMVAVDGLQRANGVVDATRVSAASNGAPATVRGLVDQENRIGGVPISGMTQASIGAWAVAKGIYENGVLRTTSVTSGFEIAGAARVSVEGYLVARPGVGFEIRGLPVREDAARGLDGAVLGRLAAGQRVQVLGQRQVDGSLRPETVIVPDRLSPLTQDVTTTPETSETATVTRSVEATAADTAATRAAAAATTSAVVRPAAAAALAAELQSQRGVYGTAIPTVTRPDLTRDITPAVRPSVVTRHCRYVQR